MQRSWTAALLLAFVGCGGGDGERPVLYPSTCAAACDAMVACGELTAGERDACVLDCQSEPWAGYYRQCRTDTCGLSEVQCESYGVRTCADACTHRVTCGDLTAGDRDRCVADCGTEPWPGRFIDCRAVTCGWSEVDCEGFTGP
jgi:hypothetical protein